MSMIDNMTAAMGNDSLLIQVPVPKINSSLTVAIAPQDLQGWLTVGIARVLGDAHANLKKEDFADAEALRAAVVAVMQKRFAGGPGGNRAPAGSRDPIAEEVVRIIRGKLKMAKFDVKALKTYTEHTEAFIGLLRGMGATEPQIVAGIDKIRADAAAIVEARAKASAGISLDDLIG